jgi:hypothetical protein
MYGLNRNGPMRGDAVKLDWLMVANDLVAADVTCCRIMGVDPRRIGHLRYYQSLTRTPGVERYEMNRDWREFVGPRFELRREFWDYPGYFAFRSPLLAYTFYHSPVASLLHRAMYLFREKFYEHA